MDGKHLKPRALVILCALTAMVFSAVTASAGAASTVTWLDGYAAPGTPENLNKVGVIKVGPKRAKNVLVLEPGSPAGATYFVPLAKWVVEKAPGWQVWSVERRQNLLEDHSVFDMAKTGQASAKQMFDYYLGYLTEPAISPHIEPVKDEAVPFARGWGMRVAVEDLARVIAAAKRQGGKVVLGGHSLGASITTAYATWDFRGKPGARSLAGLVYDDGSVNAPITAQQATEALQALSIATPWSSLNGIPAPTVGLFSAMLGTTAQVEPTAPSVVQEFFLRPEALRPPLPVTNVGMLGYATGTQSSKLSYAAQANMGSLDTSTNPAGWSTAGALTPIDRYAAMLAGAGVTGADGTEWYFPQRLLIDAQAVNRGKASPAQKVLGLRATLGNELPKRLRIYAFGAYHGKETLAEVTALARQSGIPQRNLTLVDRQASYAHNDPAAAYPNNVFFSKLVRFLGTISAPAKGRK